MFELSSIVYEVKVYLALFAAFSVLAFITRGKAALKWSKDLKMSALVNVGILKFNALFGGVFVILYVWVEQGYVALNIPHIPREVWDVMPAPLTWLALLFVYDVALYWMHRFLHNGWLWPMHAVHHSDEDLHFLSWSRGHALEQTVITIFIFLSSTWLGLSIKEIALLATIKAVHQYYVHANIDWDHGLLRKVIVSPQYHRWHHADVKAAYDKNFASIFPFIDIVFGTYYHPHSAVDVPTGFPGSPKNDFVALLAYPFTEWGRMIKARRNTPAVSSIDTEIAS